MKTVRDFAKSWLPTAFLLLLASQAIFTIDFLARVTASAALQSARSQAQYWEVQAEIRGQEVERATIERNVCLWPNIQKRGRP